jgi:predicted transcriptional regulator
MLTNTHVLVTDEAKERVAILAAMPCPGKTHSMIKNPALRHAFAVELQDLRLQAVSGGWRKALTTEHWASVRFGMESGFWALQKEENRAFIYEGKRVRWKLAEYEPANPNPQ